MLRGLRFPEEWDRVNRFNGHPPLGVNATHCVFLELLIDAQGFQWAPTLGGECYRHIQTPRQPPKGWFQWAPTLGGECYLRSGGQIMITVEFQWAPTLGGECYKGLGLSELEGSASFNGHPPLGVNATV